MPAPISMPPFSYDGNLNAAVLLIHGFTGAPDSMLPPANHLYERGFSVSVPLLAGHGKNWQTLAETNWPDWFHTCSEQLHQLCEQTPNVFVAGLSLGALLALKLAKEFPKKIKAIACLATPIFLNRGVSPFVKLIQGTRLKNIYPYQKKAKPDVKDPVAAKHHYQIDKMPLSCIRSIIELQESLKQDLSQIHTPTLLIHSPHDHIAPFRGSKYVAKHLGAEIIETLVLKNSQHLITIDYDKDIASQKMGDFFSRFIT
jgi:carboxylesterase